MPELPEVEIVKRGLAPVLEGRRIAAVIQRRNNLRFPIPAGFADALSRQRVGRVERRGKYLLFHLGNGLVVIAHLGMSGGFHLARGTAPPPGSHDHIDLITEEGVTVRYRDPRRFGFIELCREEELENHPRLARLGPDPVGEEFTAAYLAARLAHRSIAVKPAILDQRVVAGMGNIYASESLFRAGLSPKRRARSVLGRRAERLTKAIKAVFAEAIAAGGSTLRDHRRPSGELGRFQLRLAVYGRAGKPCPGCDCDVAKSGGIRRIVQAGRATFYCAKRQV